MRAHAKNTKFILIQNDEFYYSVGAGVGCSSIYSTGSDSDTRVTATLLSCLLIVRPIDSRPIDGRYYISSFFFNY